MTIPASAPAPPPFIPQLFGYRVKRDGTVTDVPNSADSNNGPSIHISEAIMSSLGVPHGHVGPLDPGSALEEGVRGWLHIELARLAPGRGWHVYRDKIVSHFRQYAHLARLQGLIDADRTNTLKAEIGSDYLVAPDVTVGLTIAAGETLHASVSCKWTIRSDRVQNIRHEAVILTRHRRGRQPHIVAVTAEPLPSRLASIARGTGEVDAVYHVALPALQEATTTYGSSEQRGILEELVGQARLFDLTELPGVIAD